MERMNTRKNMSRNFIKINLRINLSTYALTVFCFLFVIESCLYSKFICNDEHNILFICHILHDKLQYTLHVERCKSPKLICILDLIAKRTLQGFCDCAILACRYRDDQLNGGRERRKTDTRCSALVGLWLLNKKRKEKVEHHEARKNISSTLRCIKSRRRVRFDFAYTNFTIFATRRTAVNDISMGMEKSEEVNAIRQDS